MDNTNYNSIFSNYPDVVNFTQMKEMLGNIGSTLAYKLLRENLIKSIKIGRAYKIPKNNIIECLINNN